MTCMANLPATIAFDGNLVSVLMISSSDLGILMSIVLDGPHGARVCPTGYTLMALCHNGAFLHSKNNAMFIKYFKPWAEIISLEFL